MINQHLVYYLGSKLLAAVLNLAAMAVFVRMAGPATYGAYLLALAWAYVIYGLSLQWIRFAFFACFRDESAETLIATYLRLLAAGIAIIAVLAALTVAVGLSPPDLAAATAMLIAGLAGYDALHEMARTRLQSRAVAIGVITRSVLMLVLGVASLELFGTPLALAGAVGLAHAGAAIPLLANLMSQLGGRWSTAAALQLWRYGRPLIPAFGLDTLGLQCDRILLARFGALSDVGNYGAVADFIRQIMIVLSEAIAGAYMPVARARAVAGETAVATVVLGQAFLAYTALTAFGSAVILRCDRLLIDALFGASVGAAVQPAIAMIVLGNALMIFRSYYFSQVLYLMPSATTLLVSNALHAAVAAVLGIALVPGLGMFGAALAMVLGHVAGSLVFLQAWRGRFVLQLPYAAAAMIVATALGLYVVTGLVERFTGPGVIAIVLQGAITAIVVALTARRYNLLSFNELLARAMGIIRSRAGAPPAGPAAALHTQGCVTTSDGDGRQLAGKQILVVVNSDEGGGVEHLARVLRQDLERQGGHIETVFLYPAYGVGSSTKLVGLARAAWTILRRRRDIIIAFQPTSSVLAGILGRVAGCRLRVIHQSNVPDGTHPLPRFLDRLAGSLGCYSVNIMNSSATEATFAHYPASYRQRMRRIDHGIAWRPASRDRASVLSGYGIPGDGMVLLSCARLVSQKMLDTVVAAVPDLAGVRYIVAGQGPDQARLRELARTLGVADRVHFIGLVSHQDVFDLHAAADACVFPSHWETFGLAAAEAAMQGVPIIARDLAITREVLSVDGASPVTFVASAAPAAWSQAIAGVLGRPEATARAKAFAGPIRDKYSEDRMLAAYRALFAELLAEG